MKISTVSAMIILSTVIFFQPAEISATAAAQQESGPDEALKNHSEARRIFVDCDRGRTLTRALRQARFFSAAEISFTGTCEEVLLVDRDRLTLQGADESATLAGQINIQGASNITIKDFLIRGGDDQPTGTTFGGINATDGAAVTVENMRIEDISARGIRGISSTFTLRDVAVARAANGGYVFRGSSIVFEGSISANESAFGMSLVYSNGFALVTDFEFNRNTLGLIIQLSSGMEQVEGNVVLNDNAVGLFLAGQGAYAFGSVIEVRRSSFGGVIVDEISSLTPLVGAPGVGPALTVTDSAGTGVAVSRYSTFELFDPTVISGNDFGLTGDNSTLVFAGSTIEGNLQQDVSLSFTTRATFNGESNVIGHPIACDDTVVTRGTLACEVAAAPSSWSPSSALKMLRRLDTGSR